MKKILGLDLGTNSIGWAVVNAISSDDSEELIPTGIDAAGSRIIPMDAALLGDFEKGNTVSQTKKRTEFRGTRRIHERNLLRRERLFRVLDFMGFLPEHFANKLDRYGKVIDESEPKLAWRKNDDNSFDFLFKDSFYEMLAEFKRAQPQLFQVKSTGKETKIPYDWTIYYLRKKALTQAIRKEELAWILLNFNQKRGYYQLRGEDEEKKGNQLVEYYALKVVSVEDSGEKKKDEIWFNVHLENGWIYKRSSKIPLDWEGKIKEFIVTTDLNDDGSPKTNNEGNVKRSFRAPKEDDWTLLKKKAEDDIDNSGKTIGAYIYDALLENPAQKIKGKLVRTVERKYYKEELRQILEKQKEFIRELQDNELYTKCLNELYSLNEAHKNNVGNRDFTYLFIDDIIFYQRPLKSKKSLIEDCPYEFRFDKDGNKHTIKCMSKSNPIYQEFRLWQFVFNLKIYQREKEISGKLETDVDVTNEFLKSENDVVSLFDWLKDCKEITQDTLLGSYFKIKKLKGKEISYPYRWNYVEDKNYPCNETRALILLHLKKADINPEFLSPEIEMQLWHILYSVEDKHEIQQAFRKFALKHNFPDSFVEAFIKCPPFKKEYGAYSEKATKKLLALMRMGKYWNESAIDSNTKERIGKIINGEYDEKIRNRVRENAVNLTDISHFKGLPIWLACYVVYDRHSEAKDIIKWQSPTDIDEYLRSFKQHSLRNPIVEQVITETLRTVRDIWKQVGQIDEIHIELGRDMKNPKEKRKKMAEQISNNENANLRIKALLTEFLNPEYEIDNVRPYSPNQQDLLRIYEDGVLSSVSEIPEDVELIIKKFREIDAKKRPTSSEIKRYKLWLEQKYRSPYTGEMIPLAKLFTADYEIEHIIPKSRYFDDSFSNKVICESEVNQLKDNSLGYEFIKKHHGEKVQISRGKTVEILSIEAYEDFVQDNYARSRVKMKKLLMDDIPDSFIERQINDSRYISKIVKSLLSNIVRDKDENGNYEQEITSKYLIPCTGGITDRLKNDWGMNDVWNQIVLPRFKRLNSLTGKEFTTNDTNKHEIPSMPLELQKGFNKKRIDHRHHAMDAIVIACATRSHVQYLNSESAKSDNWKLRNGLARKLRRFEDVEYYNKVKNEDGIWVDDTQKTKKSVPKEFIKPWETFSQDAHTVLENIVVSFKQNLRVINKTVNRYESFKDEDGNIRIGKNGKPKKGFIKQKKGDCWAIRKPMHDKTFWGKVQIRKIKEVPLTEALKNLNIIVNEDLKDKLKELVLCNSDEKGIIKYFEDNKDVWSDINTKKIEVYFFEENSATRFLSELSTLFYGINKKEEALDKINKITDSGIRKILINHLERYDRLYLHDEKKGFEIMLNGRRITNLDIDNYQIKNILSDNANRYYCENVEIKGSDIVSDTTELFSKFIESILTSENLKIEIKSYPELAFSPDGIDLMNRDIKELNGGKKHFPIYKLRRYESLGKKFPVGENGNRSSKYVEASSGTNLFFAVYESTKFDKKTNEEKKSRSFVTVPLNIIMECQKENGKLWKEKIDNVLKSKKEYKDRIEQDSTLLFMLSPNDLVYLPESEQAVNGISSINRGRIYKMVSSSGSQCFFIKNNVANSIVDKCEFSALNKMERAITGEMIKETCIPINVNRLGKIELVAYDRH